MAQPLAELEKRFEEAYAQVQEPITRLNASYADALTRLLASETAAGKFDAVLQVKEEIEGFGDGSEFSADSFRKRKTAHPSIAAMRTKYLTERKRLWNVGRKSRADLLRNYQTALASLEQEQTKLGNLEVAHAARNARTALDGDARFSSDDPAEGPSAFRAKIHLVAKGEVELRHNGSRLSCRNIFPDRTKYTDGTSGDISVKAGDVVVVSMKSTAVYRSFILSIESEDGRTAIPVACADFRYLGADLGERALNPDPEALAMIDDSPEAGTPDADMSAMWGGKSLSSASRSGSEWVRCGPGAVWHSYGVLIREDMLRPGGP